MNRKIYRIATPLLIAVALAGCGGGGGSGNAYPLPPVGTTPPPGMTTPPPQASAYDKFLAYVKDLVATALDTSEPADVSAFDPPPTSETQEPIATQ